MAQYNLYESIGLDRRWLSASSPSPRGALATTRFSTTPLIRIWASAACGDSLPGARSASSVPGVVISRGGQSQQARQPGHPRQPQYVGRPDGRQSRAVGLDSGAKADRSRGGRKGSWRTKLMIAAMVIVLVCLLVLGLVLWIARGGGSGGGKSVKLAEELIAQETGRDRVDWFREHYDEELARDVHGGNLSVPDADAVNDQYVDLAGSGSVDILGSEDYGPFLDVSLNVGGRGVKGFESEYGVTAYDVVGVGTLPPVSSTSCSPSSSGTGNGGCSSRMHPGNFRVSVTNPRVCSSDGFMSRGCPRGRGPASRMNNHGGRASSGPVGVHGL